MPNKKTKFDIINSVIDIEGGFIDHPADSGGATNYGITEEVARENGFKGHMRELPLVAAYSIYARLYWDKLKLDNFNTLSSDLAEQLLNIGVNLGIKQASIFLQRCLNILNNKQQFYKDLKVDGIIGNKTIKASRMFFIRRGEKGKEVLIKMLNALQAQFYISLAEAREKDESFIFGWFNQRIK